MNPSKGKASYDIEVDIFAAMPVKREYNSSVQVGDIIFDLDSEGKINGIEILNASRMFNTPKVFLKNIVSCRLKITAAGKTVHVEACIRSLVRNADKVTILNVERISPSLINSSELDIAAAGC